MFPLDTFFICNFISHNFKVNGFAPAVGSFLHSIKWSAFHLLSVSPSDWNLTSGKWLYQSNLQVNILGSFLVSIGFFFFIHMTECKKCFVPTTHVITSHFSLRAAFSHSSVLYGLVFFFHKYVFFSWSGKASFYLCITLTHSLQRNAMRPQDVCLSVSHVNAPTVARLAGRIVPTVHVTVAITSHIFLFDLYL